MLNLEAKNTYHIFDSHGMLIIPSDKESWRDSLGRTVLAWIAYGKPVELVIALGKCANVYDEYKLGDSIPQILISHRISAGYTDVKKIKLLRHPAHKEEASRDHWSYFIIFEKFIGKNIIPFKRFIKKVPFMRGLYLWMHSLTENKLAEFLYYLIYIPGALIGNIWLKLCRWIGGIRPERKNTTWIFGGSYPDYDNLSVGQIILNRRTKWQKLWAWIIFKTIPAYALHNKAWQIYVMPDSKRKERLKRILLKRVAKRNVLVRLVLGDTTVTQQEVDDFPAMTVFPSGVYLDESCRRDIKKDPSKWNTYERDLVHEIWKRGFPCYNCTAKEPGHEDFCEFAWDEYNYGKTIWGCLGAK